MKKAMAMVMATILVVGLAGCGSSSSSAESTDSSSATASESKETVYINFPTASTTGTVYPLCSAIANLWNTEIDYVKASAQASNGGVDNLNLIADGDAQMGVAVTSILYESYVGEGSFEGRANEDLRVLTGLYYNPNQLVVSADSGIESISDLAGKTFAPGASGSTGEVETKIHLTELGMNYPDDIKAQFVGFTEATDLIRNKQLDGAWIMAGTPTAAVTEVTATAGGKVIGIDESLIEQLQETYPWYAKYTIPAGTYEGQDEDVLTSAIKITICTDASVDDDAAYEMTKVFWENIETLAATSPSLQGLTVADAVTDLAGVPLHDGAARYYQEVGVID
ncbi:TAXI family TRAP transporter solute-binding subunit [Chakrabartyella piscis]|uniref:TAXI family TRAP transporter solute-binding subunit n=1 Tax=Chakrabartyella piscis TaxID=2918914 RepID=UPI0029585905|nr:TAXI family TRAP transporter solute-binding subunit [Chakrabartyella piscis]